MCNAYFCACVMHAYACAILRCPTHNAMHFKKEKRVVCALDCESIYTISLE